MSERDTSQGAKSGTRQGAEPPGFRTYERRAGEIAREIGVTGGMPDNWIVSGGTSPPVGPSGATDSGERDLRGEHDEDAYATR